MILINEHPLTKYCNIEFEDASKIDSVQNIILKEHIRYIAEYSPFYKRLFKKHNIDYSEIRTSADLINIPCTTKSDLTQFNNDFLASSMADVSDICLTSATTGQIPSILYQASSDLQRLAYNEEAAFKTMGLRNNDILLITAAIDRCFMAGLAYFLGGTQIGACMVRAGSGSPAQQWQLLKISNATAIIGVPSLIRKIGEYAIESGENPANAGIRLIAAIGEPTKSQNMELLPSGVNIEKMWNAKLFSTYASTELATTFCECEIRKGGHIRPELIILEILDDNDKPVKDGVIGEVVVTPLGVRGMPLIRFKTGDISFKIPEPCLCGRNSVRIGPIIGRKNQMLKFKGTTLFPNAILAVLEEINEVSGSFIEVYSNRDGTDRIVANISLKNINFKTQSIVDYIRASIRVVPEIKIISEEELNKKIFQPEKRKKITFFDLRKPND